MHTYTSPMGEVTIVLDSCTQKLQWWERVYPVGKRNSYCQVKPDLQFQRFGGMAFVIIGTSSLTGRNSVRVGEGIFADMLRKTSFYKFVNLF